MKKLVIVLCCFGFLAPMAATAEPVVEIKQKTDVFSDADITKALQVFWENCKPLSSIYWSDIISVNAESSDEYASHRLKRGWKHSIHLAIRMSDHPEFMPAADLDIGVMAGHTLHYDIGGGQDSGFFASKRVSQKACEIKVREDGADAFKKIREFDFLGR